MKLGSLGVAVAALAGVGLSVASTQGCAHWREMRLVQTILNQAATAGFGIDEYPAIRVHLLDQKLAPGVTIASAGTRMGDGPYSAFVCQDICRLVFVDPLPTAHFAHPTLLLVFDKGFEEVVHLQRMNWWPAVDGKPVFNTVEKRNEERSILFTAEPAVVRFTAASGPLSVIAADTRRTPVPVIPTPVRPPTPAPTPTPTPPPPLDTTFAIAVNGYCDAWDSFSYDVRDFVRTTAGFGIPHQNVFVIEPPIGGATGADPCSGNVDQAFQNIDLRLKQGATCDHLLILWSSHGISKKLICTHTTNGSLEYYTDSSLAANINNLGCKSTTVIIEACQSGSVGATLASSLGGKVSILTSTDANGSSHGDIDDAGDPNPGDAGSESIWGFLEAFARSEPDTFPPYRVIDFSEAVTWAQDNDYSTTAYQNTSQVFHSGGGSHLEGPTPPGSSPAATDISIDAISISAPQGANLPQALTPAPVVRCAPHETKVSFSFTNTTPVSLANASVRILGRPQSTSGAWPDGLREIGRTEIMGNIPPGQSTVMTVVTIDSVFAAGSLLEIVAVVDSPTFAEAGINAGSNEPSTALKSATPKIVVQVVDDKNAGLDLCPNGC